MRSKRTAFFILAAICFLIVAAFVTLSMSRLGSVGQPPSSILPVPDDTEHPALRPPIAREGQIAYPQRLQVNKPATVRFSLFTPGSEPLNQVNSQNSQKALLIPDQPDLTPYVSVELEISGADITRMPLAVSQPLYGTSNTWEWQIMAQEEQPVVLRPKIHIEYHDAANKIEATYDVAWGQTHTIDKVDGDSMLSVLSSWFGNNIIGLLGIVIGVPGAISTVRSLGNAKPSNLKNAHETA